MTDARVAALARNLTEARERSGLSYGKLRLRIAPLLGGDAPTEQTIANYHNGIFTWERASSIWLIARGVL